MPSSNTVTGHDHVVLGTGGEQLSPKLVNYSSSQSHRERGAAAPAVAVSAAQTAGSQTKALRRPLSARLDPQPPPTLRLAEQGPLSVAALGAAAHAQLQPQLPQQPAFTRLNVIGIE